MCHYPNSSRTNRPLCSLSTPSTPPDSAANDLTSPPHRQSASVSVRASITLYLHTSKHGPNLRTVDSISRASCLAGRVRAETLCRHPRYRPPDLRVEPRTPAATRSPAGEAEQASPSCIRCQRRAFDVSAVETDLDLRTSTNRIVHRSIHGPALLHRHPPAQTAGVRSEHKHRRLGWGRKLAARKQPAGTLWACDTRKRVVAKQHDGHSCGGQAA